jgi:hypothetical protein
MPGSSQLSSERRDEDGLAAALKYTGKQEIKPVRHALPNSKLANAMIGFFITSPSLCTRISPLQVSANE